MEQIEQWVVVRFENRLFDSRELTSFAPARR
jgi:hypothetical protein